MHGKINPPSVPRKARPHSALQKAKETQIEPPERVNTGCLFLCVCVCVCVFEVL